MALQMPAGGQGRVRFEGGRQRGRPRHRCVVDPWNWNAIFPKCCVDLRLRWLWVLDPWNWNAIFLKCCVDLRLRWLWFL